jgi:hypothetical protein
MNHAPCGTLRFEDASSIGTPRLHWHHMVHHGRGGTRHLPHPTMGPFAAGASEQRDLQRGRLTPGLVRMSRTRKRLGS